MHPSFIAGFVKRAQENELDQSQAIHLLKEAFGVGDIDPKLLATLGTGAAGAGLGYMSGMNEDPEKDHSKRNALLGALAGSAAGHYGYGMLNPAEAPAAAPFPDAQANATQAQQAEVDPEAPLSAADMSDAARESAANTKIPDSNAYDNERERYTAKVDALNQAGALKSLQTPTIPAIPASIPEPDNARADELANWFKANPNADLAQLEAQTNHLMARPQSKN